MIQVQTFYLTFPQSFCIFVKIILRRNTTKYKPTQVSDTSKCYCLNWGCIAFWFDVWGNINFTDPLPRQSNAFSASSWVSVSDRLIANMELKGLLNSWSPPPSPRKFDANYVVDKSKWHHLRLMKGFFPRRFVSFYHE